VAHSGLLGTSVALLAVFVAFAFEIVWVWYACSKAYVILPILFTWYRAFHRFEEVKFAYGGSILDSS